MSVLALAVRSLLDSIADLPFHRFIQSCDRRRGVLVLRHDRQALYTDVTETRKRSRIGGRGRQVEISGWLCSTA